MEDDTKKYILETIESARKGEDLEEAMNDIAHMDQLEDQELDIALIKAMGDFFKYGLYGETEDTWRWDIGGITEGDFPLEKLPEHVGSIAQKLYYE